MDGLENQNQPHFHDQLEPGFSFLRDEFTPQFSLQSQGGPQGNLVQSQKSLNWNKKKTTEYKSEGWEREGWKATTRSEWSARGCARNKSVLIAARATILIVNDGINYDEQNAIVTRKLIATTTAIGYHYLCRKTRNRPSSPFCDYCLSYDLCLRKRATRGDKDKILQRML